MIYLCGVWQHFKLTRQEFYDNNDLFNVLEIKAKQATDKNYAELSTILKKQRKQLILVNHPDKGGDKNRFDQIHKAYQTPVRQQRKYRK